MRWDDRRWLYSATRGSTLRSLFISWPGDIDRAGKAGLAEALPRLRRAARAYLEEKRRMSASARP